MQDLGQQCPDVHRGTDLVGAGVAGHQVKGGVQAGCDAVPDEGEDEHGAHLPRAFGGAPDRRFDVCLLDGRTAQE